MLKATGGTWSWGRCGLQATWGQLDSQDRAGKCSPHVAVMPAVCHRGTAFGRRLAQTGSWLPGAGQARFESRLPIASIGPEPTVNSAPAPHCALAGPQHIHQLADEDGGALPLPGLWLHTVESPELQQVPGGLCHLLPPSSPRVTSVTCSECLIEKMGVVFLSISASPSPPDPEGPGRLLTAAQEGLWLLPGPWPGPHTGMQLTARGQACRWPLRSGSVGKSWEC